MVERLERLVGEVDGVAAVDEDVVGDGGEHHRLDVGEPVAARRARSRACARPRRDERVSTKRRYQLAEPVDGHAVASSSGADREAGRVVARVARDEREAVHERERAVVGVEVGEQVGHRDEHGEAGAPARRRGSGCRSRRRCARSRPRRTPASSRPSTDLAMTSVMSVLEAVAQPRAAGAPTGSASRARARRTRRRRRSSTSKPRASSAQRSSVQPETRSKRAWCQWQVTSPASTVPWCSGKPRCGQRSSIAYARAVVPEHDDRQRADLGEQLTGGLELGQRPGADLLGHLHSLGWASCDRVRSRIYASVTCDNLPRDERRQVQPAQSERPARASSATPSAASSTG